MNNRDKVRTAIAEYHESRKALEELDKERGRLAVRVANSGPELARVIRTTLGEKSAILNKTMYQPVKDGSGNWDVKLTEMEVEVI